MPSSSQSVRVGVDIGGTFTDAALLHPGGLATEKVLTDHTRPEAAILQAIDAVARASGIEPSEVDQIIHGTTLVTNALIERRGAKTAFVTTEGFRDVIEMRTESRFEQYDLNLELPQPLIPRQDRLTLAERVAASGEVLLALTDDDVADMVTRIVEGGYEAVAIGLLHAYANDTHERRIAAALSSAAPHLSISLSSVISPQMRELPRFNTVIANAYVQPQVAAYLQRLSAELRGAGITAPVFMMHSGGGLISVDTAIEQPVRLLESGPAGGAIYAAQVARSHGLDKVLSFDMGGTTAKIALVEDGAPKTATSFEVARTYRFKRGSGMIVSTPVVEMVEIGAGGGSIAWRDTLGRLQIGPHSAGSEPGPACYARGGDLPTVTDANLMLGRLDPENFAGGSIPLRPDLSRRAVEALADNADDASYGITEVVDENMANAARVHAVENGRDIERYTMVAFGGGAPLHACRLCEKLGIDTLLVPPAAGVGSAVGFLQAPFSYEASRGLFQRLDRYDAEAVGQTLSDMEAEADTFVDKGAPGASRTTRLTALMRYVGQGWEIPVSLSLQIARAGDEAQLKSRFEAAYRTFFGRTIEGLAIEITNWMLTVATSLPPTRPVQASTRAERVSVGRTRRFFDAGERRYIEAGEVARSDLTDGRWVSGPAVVTETNTSTIVTSGFVVYGQADGSLRLQRKEAHP